MRWHVELRHVYSNECSTNFHQKMLNFGKKAHIGKTCVYYKYKWPWNQTFLCICQSPLYEIFGICNWNWPHRPRVESRGNVRLGQICLQHKIWPFSLKYVNWTHNASLAHSIYANVTPQYLAHMSNGTISEVWWLYYHSLILCCESEKWDKNVSIEQKWQF